MQQTFSASATLFVLLLGYGLGSAQENVTIVAPTSEAAEDLDLRAVGELFKNSENLQAFERALNSSGVGVNNLDLDGDGKVDFIRVVEAVTDDAHLIVLQVPLGEDEFQDVATMAHLLEYRYQTSWNVLVQPDFHETLGNSGTPVQAGLLQRPMRRNKWQP